MLTKIIERKQYYQQLNNHSNVLMEHLNILKHREDPTKYFIYTKYSIGSGGVYSESEILETLDHNLEWVDAKKNMSASDLKGFLKDCLECNF